MSRDDESDPGPSAAPAGRPVEPPSPFNLLRHFTGAALAIIVVVTLIAGAAAVGLVRQAFLDMERDEADSLAEDVVAEMMQDNFGPERWGREPVPSALRRRLVEELRNFDVVEFALLANDGRPFESFLMEGGSERPPWDRGFEEALAGKVSVRWEADTWWPAVLLRADPLGVAETYAPVRVAGRQVAVARVRRDLTVMLAPAQHVLPRLLLLGALVASVVFASLWLLVRRADRLLKRQHVELEEARMQLEARNRLLEELNRRKDDFYAMVSDDLHAPLLAMRDGLQLLVVEGGDALNPFQREVLTENLRCAGAAVDLVENLLDMSRIDEEEDDLRLGPVDLVSLVRAVVATSQALAASRDVKLDVKAPVGEVEVEGDRRKLLRVVNVLVSQSIKHAASRPVTIVLDNGGAEVLLQVRNQGLGFAPEQLAALLDPDAAGGDLPEDVAHEFALVRRYVESHGGKVVVTSEFGDGATFTVTLPR